MLMTTWKLILLRLFSATLGRFAPFSRLFKLMLVRALVTNRKPEDRYVASSRFFEPGELNSSGVLNQNSG